MERESFVFYRSFFEAMECLDDEQMLNCFKALAKYALNGEELDVTGPAKAALILIKPQIDANNRKYANGCKGGRPKDNQDKTKTKPKNNQGETKAKPNDNVNDNDNENVNVNDNDKGVNYQLIADMYNNTCVSFPRLTKLSESRRKAIRARLKKYSADDLKRAFELAEESDFLKGSNNRNWSANFDWLMNDANLAKVLDGNYRNKSPSGKLDIDENFRRQIRESEVVDFGM